MKIPSTRLVHLLIGKSILETILVGALAVITFANILPPTFHGWGEVRDSQIKGWAVNNGSPWERVEVQLFVDGKFVATMIADDERPDVSAAGWARDQWHGYSFPLDGYTNGPHEARVYALHTSFNSSRKSLQLLGNPVAFQVGVNGKAEGTSEAKDLH
jgi:hypothetical protein